MKEDLNVISQYLLGFTKSFQIVGREEIYSRIFSSILELDNSEYMGY